MMPHHWRPLAHERNSIFKCKQHTCIQRWNHQSNSSQTNLSITVGRHAFFYFLLEAICLNQLKIMLLPVLDFLLYLLWFLFCYRVHNYDLTELSRVTEPVVCEIVVKSLFLLTGYLYVIWVFLYLCLTGCVEITSLLFS